MILGCTRFFLLFHISSYYYGIITLCRWYPLVPRSFTLWWCPAPGEIVRVTGEWCLCLPGDKALFCFLAAVPSSTTGACRPSTQGGVSAIYPSRCHRWGCPLASLAQWQGSRFAIWCWPGRRSRLHNALQDCRTSLPASGMEHLKLL